MKCKYLIFLALLLTSFSSITAQENNIFTTEYDFTNYAEVNSCKFRMWVPPTCQKVRGVVVAFTQMQEVVSLDPQIRKACALEDLAIVWANSLGENDYDVLENGLNALADSSGMPEIATAPFATIAHSTAGIFCRTLALANPERCFAIIQLNAVDCRDNEQLKDIPWIIIKNGAEETEDTWEEARYYFIDGKEAYKKPDGSSSGDDKAWSSPRGNGCRMSLISLVGGGHFGWSPFEARLVSTFIQKAAHYQISQDGQTITRIPEENGWLTDTALVSTPQYEPASFNDFAGDKAKAFWHIDEEMALMWQQMHQEELKKAPQTVTQSTFDTNIWSTSSRRMDLANGGITEPYPCEVSSSVAGNPIKVKVYNGIFKIVNGTDLYYSPARYNFNGTKDWITFYQEGTDTERYAETTTAQVMATGFPEGEAIEVQPIEDMEITDGPIPYNVSGSDNIDDWVVSGNVEKSADSWVIDNYTSVPRMQVYIRHAAGNHNTVKETRFSIVNSRESQTVNFDASVPTEINIGSTDAITLKATSTGEDAQISYELISGPAELEGAVLTPTGEEGIITVLAVAQNEKNNPGKALLQIEVKEIESSIISPEVGKFSVWPNPVYDNLYVKDLPEGSRVQLTDLVGRVCGIYYVAGGTTVIPVSGLQQGAYLLYIDQYPPVKIIKK